MHFHKIAQRRFDLKYSILTNSEFKQSFESDVFGAQQSVYVQAMTFEADDAGNWALNILKKSVAKDRRLLVDYYSRSMVSDRFVNSPKNWFDKGFKNEVQATRNLDESVEPFGIQMKWTNPLGFGLLNYAGRNHKKIITIDGVICYIGGINFSDHNFAWHDMMLRIENEAVTGFLEQDFLKTWEGENQSVSQKLPGIELFSLDGADNSHFFKVLFERIDSAKETILIESPYLTFPLFEKLRAAKNRRVKIDLIIPQMNNKGFVQIYNQWEAVRSGFYLWQYREKMLHLKAILIDDETLFLGSSNYDYISVEVQQEIQAVITDKNIIRDFKEKILDPDYYNSDLFYGQVSSIKGRIIYILMKLVGTLLVKTSRRHKNK